MKTTLTPTHLISDSRRHPLSPTPPTEPATLQLQPPTPNHERLYIRHILLGHPEAVRQTIHLLHTLRYADATLWSRAITLQEPLVIPPTPAEVMSLLHKRV